MTARLAPAAYSLTARVTDIHISEYQPAACPRFQRTYGAAVDATMCWQESVLTGGCYAAEGGRGIILFSWLHRAFVLVAAIRSKIPAERRRSSRLLDVFLVSSFDSPHVLYVTLAPQ